MRPSRRRFLGAMGGAAAGIAGCIAPRADRRLATRADAIFRDNLRRQGAHDERAVPDAVGLDWRLPGLNPGDHTAAKASPLAAPTGDVIVPGDDGSVYAVTPDGEVRWRAATAPSARGIHGTPAIANGSVYVGAYDGALYAFDLATGIREWRADLGDAIGSSPAYHDGTVYVAVEYYAPSGSVFGVDAATGEVTWEDERPTDHPHSTIAIDLEAGRLLVGSNDGYLYAWSYPDLTFAWRFETGGPIKGPVATHDGGAFFGSWDETIYRVALADGSLEWSVGADGDVMSGPAIDVDGGVVYVGGHDTRVYALEAATGERRWARSVDGWVIGCPALVGGRVLVGSYDRHLHCLEAATGERVWRAPASGWVTSTPLALDGDVYYTDRRSEERAGSLYKVTAA